MRVIMLALAASNLVAAAPHEKTKQPRKVSGAAAVSAKSTGKIKPVDDAELKLLRSIDSSYQSKSVEMSVEKITKIPLLEQERKAKGKLWISAGKLRMELEGAEKSLLVVNKKSLWAVTYPPPEFKDAAIQVIKSDMSTKKGRSKNFVSLLTQGGFLKFFTATAAQKESDGSVVFFLTPKQEQVDFKRAQLKVSEDGKKLLGLNYWDDRDNETRLDFSDVKFEKNLDQKLFQFTPPSNADVIVL